MFKYKLIKESKNLFFRVFLWYREEVELIKDFPWDTSVQAFWEENYSNSGLTGLNMCIGSAQERKWWGPQRVRRCPRGMKLQDPREVKDEQKKVQLTSRSIKRSPVCAPDQ